MNNIKIPLSSVKSPQSIKVNIDQEFGTMDVLSLKITNSDVYTKMCAEFGVICGHVTTSNSMPLQNVKVSVFIPITAEDKLRPEIVQLYPFETINDTFPNGVRYNLLPRIRNEKNPSHRAVGNFPDTTDLSHYPQYVEIMEKYYKYTTTTNEVGDYMIYGVPLGQQTVVMDFDLFDTSSLELTANDLVEQLSMNNSIEQLRTLINSNATETTINPNKVPNFIYKGNNNFEVEVKSDIDQMPNIFHEVKQIMVSPFWGDDNYCDVGITRCDFNIGFKYTPTAVFFGFIHSPSGGFTINSDYNYNIPNKGAEIHAMDKSLGVETGDIYPLQKMEVVVYRLDDQLNMGSRKRLGVFSGSRYNGIFRITLPMYMDYYTKNEFGDLIPTTDTNIGIPTKGYYAFEIYDTDESWNGRRVANGGFNMPILPGIRIPSTRDGDVNLGGWGGTWGGLFEYDLLNHKRLFYTVKTIHTKHNRQNVLLPGDTVGYFPEFNKNKSAAYWNFPITIDSAKKYDEPTIIGSVLIPRISVKNASSSDGSLYRPYKIINEPYISASDSYNEQIQDCENYLGLGVKLIGGKNSGDVFTDLFTANNFIINGQNIFGDKDTWNYGDNSVIPFTSTLFAIEMGKKSGAITNGFNVHSAYNHVVNDQSTYGAFINSSTGKNKESILEILIYNITDELPYLIKDKVYSSFNKGSLNVNSGSLDTIALGGDATSIYVEDSTTNIVNNNRNTDNNAYNGQFYYFGLWKEANALYDIESNYAI